MCIQHNVQQCTFKHIRVTLDELCVMILPLTRYRKLEIVYIEQTNVRVSSCIFHHLLVTVTVSTVLVLFWLLFIECYCCWIRFFFFDSIVDITCSILEFSHWVSVDSFPYFIFRFFFFFFFSFGSFIVFNKLLFFFLSIVTFVLQFALQLCSSCS